MVSTPRWGGLRIEPFDPDARDADSDGIVQEGTAWERPVGLRLIDEVGRAITRGRTSNSPIRGLRYVDNRGNTTTYKPTWHKFIDTGGEVIPEKKRKGSGLARLGIPSLKDRGHLSILDMQKPSMANASTMPEEDIATAPASVRERFTSIVERIKRHPIVQKLFPSVSPEGKYLFQGADQELSAFRSRVDRVTAIHGPITTHAHAIAAINKTFPKLRIPLGSKDTDFIDSSGNLTPAERGWVVGLLDLASEDPDIASNLTSLAHYPFEREPRDDGKQALATAGVSVFRGENKELIFGFGLSFNTGYDWDAMQNKMGRSIDHNPELSKLASQIRGETPFDSDAEIDQKRRDIRHAMEVQFAREISAGEITAAELEARLTFDSIMREKDIYHNANRGEIVALVGSGDIDGDTGVEIFYSGVATHEWAHLRDYNARTRDRGLPISDQGNAGWLDAAIPVTQLSGGIDDRVSMPEPMAEVLLDPAFFSPKDIAEMQKSIVKALNKRKQELLDVAEKWDERSTSHIGHVIGDGVLGSLLDDLDPEMKAFLQSAIWVLSEYGTTNDYELTAELMVALQGNPDQVLDELEQFAAKSHFFDLSRDEIAAALATIEDWLKNKSGPSPKLKKLETAISPGARASDSPLSTAETIERLRERLTGSKYESYKIMDHLSAMHTKQKAAIDKDPYAFTFDMDSYYGEGYTQAPRYYESMRKMIAAELEHQRSNLAMLERLVNTTQSERQLEGQSKPITELKDTMSHLVEIAAAKAVIAQLEKQEQTLRAELDRHMAALAGKSARWSALTTKAANPSSDASPRLPDTFNAAPWESVPAQQLPDGSIMIPLCTGLSDGGSRRSATSMQRKALDVEMEYKALANFQRRLRAEPYDPDARDGDGDGIVQDGTPWERPVGTYAITATGKHFARGTQLQRRPSGMRIIDTDGNEVDYRPRKRRTPVVGLERLAAATDRRKPQKQPIIERPKKVSTPLGQLGYPTLTERGHATLDDFLSPPTAPPEPPVDTELHDLSDDVAKNVTRLRRINAGAFPDLPSPDKWPPDLPVTPSDIAEERAHLDETLALEKEVVSQLEEAIIDLNDALRNAVLLRRPDSFNDGEWLDWTQQMLSNDRLATQLLVSALGYDYEQLMKDYGPGLMFDHIAQDLAGKAEDRAYQFFALAQNTGVPVININVESLMTAIASGRIKSQFETGTSRGFFGPGVRAEWEWNALDQPLDMPDHLRPIYGVLEVDTSGFASPDRKNARQYGKVRVILKDEVLDRATMTIGDSLHTTANPHPVRGSGIPYAPLDSYSRTTRNSERMFLLATALQDAIDDGGASLWHFLEDAFKSLNFDNEEDAYLINLVQAALYGDAAMFGTPSINDFPWATSYIEAQILGGVSLYDISEIVFPASAAHEFEGNPEFKAMLKILDELSIPYRFGDA